MYGPGVSSTIRGLSRSCGAIDRKVSRRRPEEQGQPLHLAIAEDLGQHPREHDPVLQRVAGARGGLGPVRQDVERAVRAPARRRRHRGGGSGCRGTFRPWQGRRKPGCPKTSSRAARRRCVSSRLRPVQVGQDQVEQPGPLDQPGLDRRGVGRRDQERDRVELPGPVHALRVAVDVVGDAVLADQVLGLFPALAQLGQADRLDPPDERLPVRAETPSARRSSRRRTRRGAVRIPGSGWRVPATVVCFEFGHGPVRTESVSERFGPHPGRVGRQSRVHIIIP